MAASSLTIRADPTRECIGVQTYLHPTQDSRTQDGDAAWERCLTVEGGAVSALTDRDANRNREPCVHSSAVVLRI